MSVEVVRRVKAALLAKGHDLSGPCGAFKITGTVCNDPEIKAQGYGLIKSSGNGCPNTPHGNVRADTLMLPDGRVWDLLIKSENNEGDTSDPLAYNIPQWSQTGPQPAANWRAPYDLGLLDGATPPVDPPVVQPPIVIPPAPPAVDYAPYFKALSDQIAALKLEGSGSMKVLGQSVTMNIKLAAVSVAAKARTFSAPVAEMAGADAPAVAPRIAASNIRQVLTVLGTLAASHGYIADGQVAEVVGILMVAGSWIWSQYTTWKSHQKLVDAIAAPAGEATP